MADQTDLLKLFAGAWAGGGHGEFPGIEPFEYLEDISFDWDERRPTILHYLQKTSRRSTGQSEYVPSHWETGFLRLLPDSQVEIGNVQSSGRLEALAGSLEVTPTGLVLHLESTAFANDTRMQAATRLITLNVDQLHYVVRMRTSAVPEMALHLEGNLTRKEVPSFQPEISTGR